ncbi:MAG: PA2169 family four-helix-bundle protein [Bacteroidetes bacterium]|nr:PA2169 family four-helix-bundle protein [Bacteroidota bacterium]
MNTEKTVDVLNSLIEINNERIEGYKTATKETREKDLKILFSQLIKTSQICKVDLNNEVQQLGGTPIIGIEEPTKLLRIWNDVKTALKTRDRKVILSTCEYVEDVADTTYKKTLRNHIEDFTLEQKMMLKAQYDLIKADYDKVKNMRDRVLAYN